MKPIRKRKAIEVAYKGFRAVQYPWKSDYGMQYGLRIYNDKGELELRASYGRKCLTRKELKLELMDWVKKRDLIFEGLAEYQKKNKEAQEDETIAYKNDVRRTH